MTASGFKRGHRIVFDGAIWRYEDGAPTDHERPCPQCGHTAERDGPDPCLGWIDGLRSACCGHGVHGPYQVPEEGIA